MYARVHAATFLGFEDREDHRTLFASDKSIVAAFGRCIGTPQVIVIMYGWKQIPKIDWCGSTPRPGPTAPVPYKLRNTNVRKGCPAFHPAATSARVPCVAPAGPPFLPSALRRQTASQFLFPTASPVWSQSTPARFLRKVFGSLPGSIRSRCGCSAPEIHPALPPMLPSSLAGSGTRRNWIFDRRACAAPAWCSRTADQKDSALSKS